MIFRGGRDFAAPFLDIRCDFVPGLSRLELLCAAGTVVRQDTGRWVIHIAALPFFVGHPEIHNHFSLAGIVFLEYITIQK